MTLTWLLIGILAVWRVTHLLHAEPGPGRIFLRWREALEHAASEETGWQTGRGIVTIAAQAFECFYCLSLWVALPVAFAIGNGWKEWVLGWLALSGGAILAERITTSEPVPDAESSPEPFAGLASDEKQVPPRPVEYWEDPASSETPALAWKTEIGGYFAGHASMPHRYPEIDARAIDQEQIRKLREELTRGEARRR